MKFPLYDNCPFCKHKLTKVFVPAGFGVSQPNINEWVWEKYSCENVKEQWLDDIGRIRQRYKTSNYCESFEDHGNVMARSDEVTNRQIEFKIQNYVVIYYVEDKITVISDSSNKFQASIELPYFLDIDFDNVNNTLNKIKTFFLFS